MPTQLQIVLDAARPDDVARFWAEALHYVVQPPPEGFDTWPDFLREMGVPEELWDSRSAVVDPAGNGPRVFIQRVPEPKTVKNRVHLDLQVGAGRPPEQRPAVVAEEVARLEGLGAKRLTEHDQMGEHWVVMADPEGNEFCVS